MTKDVIIEIKGTQGLDGKNDQVELTTFGRYGTRDGGYYLSYDESEMIGVKGVKTLLHVRMPDTVILQRSGALRSRLVVQQGVRSNCFYSTPEGDLTIGIFGESIRCDLSGSGGKISMSYTIDSNLQLVSRNIVEITVREVRQNVTTRSQSKKTDHRRGQ